MLILKVGGQKNINWGNIISDLKEIRKTEQVVLVHGANQIRDEIADRLGQPSETITSPSGVQSVFTDDRALDVLLMAYPGVVNSKIVASMIGSGINAVGLSGIDGGLWVGRRKKKVLSKKNGKIKVIRDSYTGKVESINSDLIKLLLSNDYLPVISTPAVTKDGEIINTDNDNALVQMAISLKSKQIVSLFCEPGLLKDSNDSSTLIKRVNLGNIEDHFQFAKGRMKKKIMSAKTALENNITVYWGDIKAKKPITSALSGNGTILRK